MSFDSEIFRAYDLRGTYPDQVNADLMYAAGQAFVKVMQPKNVVVGRDVRATGVELQAAMIEGILDMGVNVMEIGVISTEMLYFASFTLECDGGMSITASHNPKEWNGIKFIAKDAVPLTKEDKLGEIYDAIKSHTPTKTATRGVLEHINLLPTYVDYLKKYLPKNLSTLKAAINVNFGANGKIVDGVFEGTGLDIIRLNWEEDGTFPKGTPDPLLPKNRQEIMKLIVDQGADFGIAFDADADRCFFYDEKGRFFHGYYANALMIDKFLEDFPGSNVVAERRLTWANLDAIERGSGKVVFSRTGHGYIKAAMRESDAVYGGETSGHYYFRDFHYADNGMISFLTVLAMFARSISEGKPVSLMLDNYLEKYPICLEEQNYITERASEIIETAAKKFSDAEQNHLDGLTVEYATWRFNLRMSSNEPVLRLNYEARNTAELEVRGKELADFIASFGAKLRDDH